MQVWSVENMNTYNLRKTIDNEKRKEKAPKFPEVGLPILWV